MHFLMIRDLLFFFISDKVKELVLIMAIQRCEIKYYSIVLKNLIGYV